MMEVREQKLIFLDSATNVRGNGVDFDVELPSNRFRSDPPMDMKLNLHQFEMRKTYPTIHYNNMRFFVSILEPAGEGVNTNAFGKSARMYPIDILGDYIGNAGTGVKTIIDPTSGSPLQQRQPITLSDVYRLQYDDWGVGGDLPVDKAPSSSAVPPVPNQELLGYSYKIPPNCVDLRTALEYSINMRLKHIEAGYNYDPNYNFDANPNLTDPVSNNCLAVQVGVNEGTGCFELFYCDGLPDARFPRVASNRYDVGTFAPIPVGSGFCIVGNRMAFHFPQVANPSPETLTNALQGWSASFTGNAQFINPPYVDDMLASLTSQRDCFQDSGELLGAHLCRNDLVAGYTGTAWSIPATPPILSTGLIPYPSGGNAPDNVNTGFLFQYPPILDTLFNIVVHAVNIPNNNFETIGFSQSNNTSVQKICNPSTILGRVPVPQITYNTGSTGVSLMAYRAQQAVAQPTSFNQRLSPDFYDKISWEAPFANIFGIRLEAQALNSVKILLTDTKLRPFSTYLIDDTQSLRNLATKMTICFHIEYHPPVPRPVGIYSETPQELPSETKLGGANTNTIMEQQAQMSGKYFGTNF